MPKTIAVIVFPISPITACGLLSTDVIKCILPAECRPSSKYWPFAGDPRQSAYWTAALWISVESPFINNLFTPFYRSKRVKNNTPGFGLGLTICKKIIEAHSGKLSLSTNDDEIQFSIEIPINK